MSVLWVLALLPVALIALVIAVALVGALAHRRELRRLAEGACAVCGSVLGVAAVRAAVSEREDALAERFAEAKVRGVKLRIVPPPLRVRCPVCGEVASLQL